MPEIVYKFNISPYDMIMYAMLTNCKRHMIILLELWTLHHMKTVNFERCNLKLVMIL